jgi:hypothetical protein
MADVGQSFRWCEVDGGALLDTEVRWNSRWWSAAMAAREQWLVEAVSFSN